MAHLPESCKGTVPGLYYEDAGDRRLSRAAPDLLAALRELLLAPNKNRPEWVWQQAREAVREATGED